MASKYIVKNDAHYVMFCDNESTTTPQDAADLAAKSITWDPDDQASNNSIAEIKPALAQALSDVIDAQLHVKLGADGGTSATSWKLQAYDDVAADWMPVIGAVTFTVAASAVMTPLRLKLPPGAQKFRIIAASGNLDATNYYASASVYIAIRTRAKIKDLDETRA